jgi:hypothetical protein
MLLLLLFGLRQHPVLRLNRKIIIVILTVMILIGQIVTHGVVDAATTAAAAAADATLLHHHLFQLLLLFVPTKTRQFLSRIPDGVLFLLRQFEQQILYKVVGDHQILGRRSAGTVLALAVLLLLPIRSPNILIG